MPDEDLIVPVVIPNGALHFATVKSDAVVQDALDALIREPDAISEVLGDLDQYGWALQKIRLERNGRQWEEEELEALGNGDISCTLLHWTYNSSGLQ